MVWGSTVTIFQLESMYASNVPSLSFVGQTEADIHNCPPLGRLRGGSDPPEGGGGSVGIGVTLRVGVNLFHHILITC